MSTTTAVDQFKGTITWNVDPAHSSVDFTVRHMGIFTVRGSLGTLSGTATTEDAALKSIDLTIDATAISTNNGQRDAHLKSADFLNVEQYPQITFKSTNVVKKSDTDYAVTGDLTVAGQTKPVTVDFEVIPPTSDPWGSTRAGVTGKGKLLRKDWGLNYNSVMETGHLLIADEVNFTFDIQAVAAK